MRQGDIYLADLHPTKGSEQAGRRPIVIVSGNMMNEHFEVVIVCPISSVVKNFEGCVVLGKGKDHGLSKDSEVITFQIRAISKSRLKKHLGSASEKELTAIKKGLFTILTY